MTHKIFVGEWMVCHLCHKKQRSSKNTHTGWTAIEIVEEKLLRYYCPECWSLMLAEVRKSE